MVRGAFGRHGIEMTAASASSAGAVEGYSLVQIRDVDHSLYRLAEGSEVDRDAAGAKDLPGVEETADGVRVEERDLAHVDHQRRDAVDGRVDDLISKPLPVPGFEDTLERDSDGRRELHWLDHHSSSARTTGVKNVLYRRGKRRHRAGPGQCSAPSDVRDSSHGL